MSRFAIEVNELTDMMQVQLTHEEQQEHLKRHGRLTGLAAKLRTHLTNGLDPSDAHDHAMRAEQFGKNQIPATPSKSFLSLMWEAVQDKILIILIICAFFSLVLALVFHSDVSLDEEFTAAKEPNVEWIEGLAILIAVSVVVLVTAFNDWSKDKQFQGLKAKINGDKKMSVIRGGQINELPVSEILVGDICQIFYGHIMPADGVVVESNDLKLDESSLTGETDQIKKGVDKPMLFSGNSCYVNVL